MRRDGLESRAALALGSEVPLLRFLQDRFCTCFQVHRFEWLPILNRLREMCAQMIHELLARLAARDALFDAGARHLQLQVTAFKLGKLLHGFRGADGRIAEGVGHPEAPVQKLLLLQDPLIAVDAELIAADFAT